MNAINRPYRGRSRFRGHGRGRGDYSQSSSRGPNPAPRGREDFRGNSRGQGSTRSDFRGDSSQGQSRDFRSESTAPRFLCSYCGYNHTPNPERCPARNKHCNNCNGFHHFSNCCPRRSSTTSQASQNSDRSARHVRQTDYYEYDSNANDSNVDFNELYVCSVHDNGNVLNDKVYYNDLWSVNLVLSKNVHLNVKIDTQAQCNVMGVHTYEKLLSHGIPMQTRPSKGVLNVYGGGRLVPVMEVLIRCSYKDVTTGLIFQVVDAQKTPTLLGDTDSVKMRLIKRIYSLANDVLEKTENACYNDASDSFVKTKSKLLEQYADVFSGVGTIPGEYHIEVDPEVEPVVHPPRPVPVAQRSKVKAEQIARSWYHRTNY